MFPLVKIFMRIYDAIEPLENDQGGEIHEKHFLLKVHFEYSKFVPFFQEVKDLCSLTSAVAHFYLTLPHNEIKRFADKILPVSRSHNRGWRP